METRPLTTREIEEINACEGSDIYDMLTCEGDHGYGPCGTYRDWNDGRCKRGHEIEVIIEEGETE